MLGDAVPDPADLLGGHPPGGGGGGRAASEAGVTGGFVEIFALGERAVERAGAGARLVARLAPASASPGEAVGSGAGGASSMGAGEDGTGAAFVGLATCSGGRRGSTS